ncbi:hypothetical protein DSO57_1030142 [Entomophthora muscae]|uniref:Uncharacterized protein n=1 Tax=Entomophthora muscae TaxID=34485 RepID=A0ACC2S340_9FUNG|nr:hypothetical protein DSO57_1030142 [Entomophthora muscae]
MPSRPPKSALISPCSLINDPLPKNINPLIESTANNETGQLAEWNFLEIGPSTHVSNAFGMLQASPDRNLGFKL